MVFLFIFKLSILLYYIIIICSSEKGAAKESNLMKSLSFKKCSESVKREADLFEIPTWSKKLKTENWDFKSSTESLILDFWKRDFENTPPPMMWLISRE